MKQGMNSVNRICGMYCCMPVWDVFRNFLVHLCFGYSRVRLQDGLMNLHFLHGCHLMSFCGVGLSMRYGINERAADVLPLFFCGTNACCRGLIAAAVILLLSNYLLLGVCQGIGRRSFSLSSSAQRTDGDSPGLAGGTGDCGTDLS